jgi:hypothetical protein
MVIRKEQMDAISNAQQQAYARRLLGFFRRTIPEITARYSETFLLDLVAQGVKKALRYGVTGGPAIARFVGLMLLVKPSFDEIPEVRRFLTIPDLDPDFRIKILSDLLAQRLRE